MIENQESADGAARFKVRLSADAHFSWLRTRLAIESTMMAYMRTAASLIGFGFAIVQFFDRLGKKPAAVPAYFPDAPRYLGLALILGGVCSMVISLWSFRWMIDYMWSEPFGQIAGMTKERWHTPLYVLSCFLTAAGVFAFFAVVLRLV